MSKRVDEMNTDLTMASILVVDDEAANVLLVEKILAMKGYTNVVSTQDPLEVVSLYKEHKSDLILLDLDMPELDGYGVMDQLNALTENNPPPILVLTAQHLQSYRQRALDSGARDYVTKPFDANELLSRVRNLLEVQMAHNYMLYQNEILELRVQERTSDLLIAKNVAEEASRAKTAFLSNMSHELRTPLNGIMGFSEIMRDQVFGSLGNEQYIDYASDIHGAAEHLLAIISNILDISHIMSGERDFKTAPINLRETIEFCERMVRKRATEAGVSISINVAPEISMIMAEDVRMKQIVLNLLTNSIKYAPKGQVNVSAEQQDDKLVIKVSDTGIGISKKDIDMVLRPFGQVRKSADTAHEGVGLGLYLTQAFTEMHGGDLEIDSVLGQGATVSLIFPMSKICVNANNQEKMSVG